MPKFTIEINMDDPQEAWDALYERIRRVESGEEELPKPNPKPVHPMMDPANHMQAMSAMMRGRDDS